MNDIVLYSMIGDKFVEAFDPRCVFAHRVFNYKQVHYQLKVMSIPEDYSKFKKTIITFPIIAAHGQIYHSASDLRPFFRDLNPDRILEGANPYDNPMGAILFQWGVDTLGLLRQYFFSCVDANWKRFISDIKKRSNAKRILASIEHERKIMRSFLKRTLYSRYDYEELKQFLDNQLQLIETLLQDSAFLSGPKIHSADLMVFSQLHILFHPYITETDKLIDKHPSLIRWAKEIDFLTSGSMTKPFHGGFN